MPKKHDYDKALFRLVKILTMIANNQRPTTHSLATEFNVTVKTIQNDIYKRLIDFPIEKDSVGFKFADGFSLTKTALDNDEMIILSLALSQFEDIEDFDKTTSSILKKLLNPTLSNPYYIKKDDIEDLEFDNTIVETLEDAINRQLITSLTCKSKTVEVEPYKIANFDGIWYLFAKETNDAKIKTFRLSNIQQAIPTTKKHKTSKTTIDEVLDNVHSAWFNDGESFEVIIKVNPNIAYYFEAKNFLQTQEIVRKLDDGSLIVSFEVSHAEDIDNIIKSLLPDVEVLEPEWYKEQLHNELTAYIKKVWK